MTKNMPPKLPTTNNLVKTVAGALGVNVKRSERLQAKIQERSLISDLNLAQRS